MFLLPLVAVLALLAVHRNAAWPAVLALVLVGLSFQSLWDEVAHHQPSDGWEEADKQRARSEIVRLTLGTAAVAGLSLYWVIAVRLLGPPREPAPERSGVPPTSPDWKRLWKWFRRRFGWLVLLAAILALMVRLAK